MLMIINFNFLHDQVTNKIIFIYNKYIKMSVIELLWYLNVTDGTKYLIILGFIICVLIMCMINGKKKNKKNRKKKSQNYDNYDNYDNYSPTKCQSNYLKCMENNIKNDTNEFCYPCLNDGNAPDFFYNPQIKEWVKA